MFFTAVSLMNIREHWHTEFDLTKPTIEVNKQKGGKYIRTLCTGSI